MDSRLTHKDLKEHARQYSSSSGYSCPDSEFSSLGASTLASRATDYEVYGKEPHQNLDAPESLKAVPTVKSIAPLRIQKAARWINTQLSPSQRSRHPSSDSTSHASSSQRQSLTLRGSDIPRTPQTPDHAQYEWPHAPSTPVVHSPKGCDAEGEHQVRISSLSSPPDLFQSVPYSPLVKFEDTKALERMRKRHNCIRELYNTEYLFAQDMAVVVRLYMCASADIGLSVRQIDTLFSNVPQVLDISLSLVAVLEANVPTQILQGDGSLTSYDVAADTKVRVGGAMCLSLNGQLYEVYEDYIHHSQQQLELYYQLTRHLRQRPQRAAEQHATSVAPAVNPKQIESWLAHCGARAAKFTTAWSLDSLLLKPVQRLGKYPLFLQTLLDCTSPEHEDYRDIERAFRRSKQYMDCVNARLRQSLH